MKNNILKTTVVFFFICIGMLYAQRAQILVIDANQNWNTGVLGEGPVAINSGEELWIFARGFAVMDNSTVPNAGLSPLFEWFAGGPGGVHAPSGNDTPLPGAPWNSLICKIGSGGTPFYVGTGCQKIAQESGSLYFRMNDSVLGDNGGFIVILIYVGSSPTTVFENDSQIPASINLDQNYPNPFNPSTKINYSVNKQAKVQIKIYDINGQLIKVLVDKYELPGNYEAIWNGDNSNNRQVASGQYFYQLIVDNNIDTKKMILLK